MCSSKLFFKKRCPKPLLQRCSKYWVDGNFRMEFSSLEWHKSRHACVFLSFLFWVNFFYTFLPNMSPNRVNLQMLRSSCMASVNPETNLFRQFSRVLSIICFACNFVYVNELHSSLNEVGLLEIFLEATSCGCWFLIPALGTLRCDSL